MKPRTYFRLALLFPYVLWIVCALIVAILSSAQETSGDWNIMLMPIVYYAFGAILWFIPYTLLAIGLWIWSRNKTTKSLLKLALFAPILLFAILLIETVWISLPVESVDIFIKDAMNISVLLGGFSLVCGYLCVGIAFGVFKFLQARNIISDEISPLLSTD